MASHTRFYRGRSMSGTFRPGDCLIVDAVALSDLHLGDVVVYRSTNHNGEEDALVHRIVAIKPEGLVARGDNNPGPDAALVTADNLLGQVARAERGRKTHRVIGGRLGLLRVRARRVRRRMWRYAWWLAARVGRKPYRRLRASGIVARVWQPRVVKIRLSTDQGALVKYVCGGRTVARWWTQSNRFECAKPYDLVIPGPKRP